MCQTVENRISKSKRTQVLWITKFYFTHFFFCVYWTWIDFRQRKVLENRSLADEERMDALENQLKEARFLAEEADKKYDEVLKILFVWNKRTNLFFLFFFEIFSPTCSRLMCQNAFNNASASMILCFLKIYFRFWSVVEHTFHHIFGFGRKICAQCGDY